MLFHVIPCSSRLFKTLMHLIETISVQSRFVVNIRSALGKTFFEKKKIKRANMIRMTSIHPINSSTANLPEVRQELHVQFTYKCHPRTINPSNLHFGLNRSRYERREVKAKIVNSIACIKATKIINQIGMLAEELVSL